MCWKYVFANFTSPMSRIALQIARKSVRVSGLYFALHATTKRAVYVTKKRKRGSISQNYFLKWFEPLNLLQVEQLDDNFWRILTMKFIFIHLKELLKWKIKTYFTAFSCVLTDSGVVLIEIESLGIWMMEYFQINYANLQRISEVF